VPYLNAIEYQTHYKALYKHVYLLGGFTKHMSQRPKDNKALLIFVSSGFI